jgi:hypothetical protein
MRTLDVHCKLDDGFALCGGNYVPRVAYDHFINLGEVLSNASPQQLSSQRWPIQRCAACVAMIAPTSDERST